jgi:alpha-tubulin suppressor-like RCC1 family protein
MYGQPIAVASFARATGYGGTGQLWDVTYGNGVWVIVGDGGKIYTSTNRTTWTERTSNTTQPITGVAWATNLGLFAAVGSNGYIATSTDGTIWTWGRNVEGQLGQGNTTNYSSPKQVGALTNWSKLSSGFRHCCAQKTDGTLWSWGQNTTGGQLGLGNTTSRSSPVQIGSLTSWGTPTSNGYNTLAILTTT